MRQVVDSYGGYQLPVSLAFDIENDGRVEYKCIEVVLDCLLVYIGEFSVGMR
jgi:hypothetical protein